MCIRRARNALRVASESIIIDRIGRFAVFGSECVGVVNKMIRSVFVLFVGLFLALPASANITVSLNGSDYEIVFLNDNSWDSNSATLSNTTLTPWFGSAADALTVANQIAADYGSLTLPGGKSEVWLAYNAGANVTYATGPGAVTAGGFWPANQALPGAAVWATTGGAIVVPEINGSNLAKVLFLLGTLALILQSRRKNLIHT